MTQAFNLAQFANNLNASGQAAAGTSLTGAVPVANGGTNLTTAPTNGQLLIGNGTGYTQAVLTAGTGITVTNAAGAITIAGGGVTSAVAGNGIAVSGATGAVTVSLGAAGNNTVGSYAFAKSVVNQGTLNYGSSVSGSSLRSTTATWDGCAGAYTASGTINPGLSGTWKYLGCTFAGNPDMLLQRIA